MNKTHKGFHFLFLYCRKKSLNIQPKNFLKTVADLCLNI